jgi:hypothetical protein
MLNPRPEISAGATPTFAAVGSARGEGGRIRVQAAGRSVDMSERRSHAGAGQVRQTREEGRQGKTRDKS